MTDVEDLLRETLTDPRRTLAPGPGIYEAVQVRAHDRRHRRTAIGATTLAVVALAVTGSIFGAQAQGHHRASPVSTPAPSNAAQTPATASPPQGRFSGQVNVGTPWITVTAAVTTPDALYALTSDPNEVVGLAPTSNDTGSNAVKATVAGPSGTPGGIAVSGDHVWAWSQETGELRMYDARSLTLLASIDAGMQIYDAAATPDSLWMTDGQGVFAWTPMAKGGPALRQISGLSGYTFGIAADPTRHRVLLGLTPAGSPPANQPTGAEVVAVDANTGTILAESSRTYVGKESIAVVGDQVWIGGYGDSDKQRIVHLDATTLRVVGSSPVNAQLGPGAILWPGQNVLWVRDGGDEGLSCIDPTTGQILEQWAGVQGPVTSVGGSAYGIQGGLQRLSLSGSCTG